MQTNTFRKMITNHAAVLSAALANSDPISQLSDIY